MHLDWLVVGGGIFWLLWATYMKTYRTDTWLKLQEAGDRRRGKVVMAVGRMGMSTLHRIFRTLHN